MIYLKYYPAWKTGEGERQGKRVYSDHVPRTFGASQVAPITLVLVFIPTDEQTQSTSQVEVLIVSTKHTIQPLNPPVLLQTQTHSLINKL